MGYDAYNTLVSGFSVSSSRYQDEIKSPGESLSLNFVALDFMTFNEQGVPMDSVRHHIGTNTSTLRSGPNLEVTEVIKEQKESKQKKKEIKSEEASEEAANGVVAPEDIEA